VRIAWKYALFVDETDRGDILKTLGELITQIEYDMRIKR